MSTTEIKNEIINSIAVLSSAIAKVEGNDIQKKDALGTIGLVANYNLARVCTALNNELFPEGSANYIPVDANGLPLKSTESEDTGADEDTDTEDENDANETDESANDAPEASIDRIFAAIKSYYPTFDKDTLIQRFGNGGVKASLAYLLDVTGTRQIGELERTIDGENVVFTFKVANGAVAENFSMVEEYLGELVKYSGGEVVSVTSNEIDGGRAFKVAVKGTKVGFHEVRLSPLGKFILSLFIK